MPLITPIAEIKYSKKALDAISFESDHDRKVFDIFVASVSRDIVQLNQKIAEFNQAQTPDEKRQALHAISQMRQKINHRYPYHQISCCKPYQEHIQQRLWKEVKEELNVLNGGSLGNNRSVPDILSNLDHKEIIQIMRILWDNVDVPRKLSKFFPNHSVSVIPGGFNSRNLKIEPYPPDGTAPLVITVDPRMGLTKEHEQDLRNQSFKHLAQLYGEPRQATFTSGGQTLTAEILVSDFFPGGDLKSSMDNRRASITNPEQILAMSLNFYQQMATALLEMQQNGKAFPDAKNTNWLVDGKDKLQIRDGKSLVAIDIATGLVHYNSFQNQWTKPISSAHLHPSEFNDYRIPFSADKMHTYLLGKNLYHALTGCTLQFLRDTPPQNQPRTFTPKQSFQEADFNLLIFQSPDGQRLKMLIQKMVQPDPSARITLSDTLRELTSITLNRECEVLLEKLEALTPQQPGSSELVSSLQEAMLHRDVDKLQEMKNFLILEIELNKAMQECQAVYKQVKMHFESSEERRAVKKEIDTAFEQGNVTELQTLKVKLNTHRQEFTTVLWKECIGYLDQMKEVLDNQHSSTYKKQLAAAYGKNDLGSLQTLKESLIELRQNSIEQLQDKCVALYKEIKPTLDKPTREKFREGINTAYQNGDISALQTQKSALENLLSQQVTVDFRERMKTVKSERQEAPKETSTHNNDLDLL